MYALLCDPGGVLDTRLPASRTAAFRPLETVGFPLALRALLSSTTILISGLHHPACLLTPSSSVLLLRGVHGEFATDLLARLWSGGTGALSARTHWVTITSFMRTLSIPRFRAYLGATSAWLGLAKVYRFVML